MKKIITREEKLKLISDFKQGGLTTTAFTKEQKLNIATFRSWLYNNYKINFLRLHSNGRVELICAN